MFKSKVANSEKYKYNDARWIVSLLVTGEKSVGTHAKIIVEGINNSEWWTKNKKDNPEGKNLYVAEYHIIPFFNKKEIRLPSVTNPTGKYKVFYTERPIYKPDKIDQYRGPNSRYWRISKERAIKMIKAIKLEEKQQEGVDKDDLPDYQYYGINSFIPFYSIKAHNCVTWCIEKLKHARIVLDSTYTGFWKASPIKEVQKGKDRTVEDHLENDCADKENGDNQQTGCKIL